MDLQHLRDYTRALKRRLPKSCFEPVPHRLLWSIPHLAGVIVGIYVNAFLPIHIGLKLLIAVVIGGSFASLGFLGHEILHGSVTRRAWLRNTTGSICFFPFAIGPRLWRKWHNVEHHGHTQDEDEDPDAMGTLEAYRERPELQRFYRLMPFLRSAVTFGSFTFWFAFHGSMMLKRFLPEFPPKQRPIVLAQFVLPVVTWVALLVLAGPVGFTLAFLVPFLLANLLVMSYIATNHLLNPLTPVNDPLANSLTVRTARVLDILHLNFSHHTEHHIFPAMNPKYAPRVKALLKEMWPDRYHEMSHGRALFNLWRTPRLYREHTQLVDPVRGLVFPTVGHGLDERSDRAHITRVDPTPVRRP